MIVPGHCILSFVLGESHSHAWLSSLLDRLRRCITDDEETATRELVLDTCHTYLSRLQKSKNEKDLYLGPIAVNAAILDDTSLFAKTVKKMKETLEPEYYRKLGESIDIQEPVVEEHE